MSQAMTPQQAPYRNNEATARSNLRASVVFHWLPLLSFLFLTVSAGSSAYFSRRNPAEVAFILIVYVDSAALLVCLVRFQQLQRSGDDAAAPSMQERERLKAAVWALSTVLNLAFAWHVGNLTPPPLAAIVWAMAAAVSVGGFYGLFIYNDAADHSVVGHGYVAVGNNEVTNGEKL